MTITQKKRRTKKNEANKSPIVLVSGGSGTRRRREGGDSSTGLFQVCRTQRRRRRRKSGQSGAQSRLSHGVGELHEVSAREGRGEWSPRTQHALRLRLAGARLAQFGSCELAAAPFCPLLF